MNLQTKPSHTTFQKNQPTWEKEKRAMENRYFLSSKLKRLTRIIGIIAALSSLVTALSACNSFKPPAQRDKIVVEKIISLPQSTNVGYVAKWLKYDLTIEGTYTINLDVQQNSVQAYAEVITTFYVEDEDYSTKTKSTFSLPSISFPAGVWAIPPQTIEVPGVLHGFGKEIIRRYNFPKYSAIQYPPAIITVEGWNPEKIKLTFVTNYPKLDLNDFPPYQIKVISAHQR